MNADQADSLITAPLIWPTVAEVHRGYLQALGDTGELASPALVSEVPEFSVEAGRAGLARLLDLPDAPSAVFAAGSSLAFGALYEARSRGLDVPRDLAIVGYTDSPLAGLADPPLTLVQVPAHEIGLRAMRTLSDLIHGKRPRRRRTVLPSQLVLRDSSGVHDPDNVTTQESRVAARPRRTHGRAHREPGRGDVLTQ